MSASSQRPARISKVYQVDDLEAMLDATEKAMDSGARRLKDASLAAHPMRFRVENPQFALIPKRRRIVHKPRKSCILQLAEKAHHGQVKALLRGEQCNLPASTTRQICDAIAQRCIRANARTEKKTLAAKQRLAELQLEEDKHKSIIVKNKQFLKSIIAEAFNVGSNDIAEDLLPVIEALDAIGF